MTDRVMNRGTDYAETEALLATLADDAEGLDRQLRNLYPSERRKLLAACYTIAHAIQRMPEPEGQGA
ncbi:hypothetical protein [Microbacterium schleiferi]|uniref:hypothetical protein n=1 Tax=Microbacterium schleiferi TaxID=69362 RepID=UPI001D170E99|nr:hypothetical protein [Microbacterium schleiferi]MCC4266267.1 hypothetical protein [Microbacterium schleiferi]